MTDEKNESRRGFLKTVLGVGLTGLLASIAYPVLMYLKPPAQREVEVSNVLAGTISDFDTEASKIIRFGNKPVLVIKTPAGDFRAFSAVCTHLDCTVQYRNDMGAIWCACHNGKFDLNGRNISGPPPAPLTQYLATVKGDEVYVSKKV
jgi:cytochrome b6-f complex iron-sulfur subunit